MHISVDDYSLWGPRISEQDTRGLSADFWEVFRFFLQIITWSEDSNSKEDQRKMTIVPLKSRWMAEHLG